LKEKVSSPYSILAVTISVVTLTPKVQLIVPSKNKIDLGQAPTISIFVVILEMF